MTTEIAKCKILVKDASGNWYSIPLSMESEFVTLNECAIEADCGSVDWQTATDELQSTFGEYQV